MIQCVLMTLLADALCSEHPHTLATGTCSSCGRFTCGFCTLSHQGSAYCTQCVERLQLSTDGPIAEEPNDSASSVAVASVVMGVLGLCLPLCGLIGLVLGVWELFRIRDGSAPPGGRRMAITGIVLSVGLAVLSGVLLSLFLVG